MLYCKENEDCIFHIHIPRTAGRFIKELFSYNCYKVYHTSFSTRVEGIECPHLHYPLYNLLEGVEESKNFTIVRDPFEKFKSSIKLIIKARNYGDQIYRYLRDESWLVDFLNYERSVGGCYIGNFFRPQNEFISEKTFIYKYENGIDENFIKWVKTSMGLDLKYAKLNYPKGPVEEIKDPKNFSEIECLIDDKVKKIIKNYYRKDYEIFNYD